MPQTPLTAIIITHQEEKNLPECLRSIAGWTREIIIVDSGSTDRTKEIADKFGARWVTHPFETHSKQWKWTLENVPIATDWVFGFDADQRITPELRDEIVSLFTSRPEELATFDGFFVRRRQVFRGKWIRHGAYYPIRQLLMYRLAKAHVDTADFVDHHITVHGNLGNLKHDMVESNRKEEDISFWIDKHNRYAVLQAREELRRRRGEVAWQVRPRLFGTPDQQKVWLKDRWSHLPLYVRPFIYYFYRYFVRLGFLDGKQGFLFHFLQAFWYRLLVDINLDQLMTEEKKQAKIEARQQAGGPPMPV